MIYEITLSRVISEEELRQAITLFDPTIDTISTDDDYSANCWFEIILKEDKKWPCRIGVFAGNGILSCENVDIDFAELLFNEFKINSIVFNMCELISGLDPQDPFWCLALINGDWYFADTSGMELHGSYCEEKPEYNDISLLQQIDLSSRSVNMFYAADFGLSIYQE
jgi:hypothetical protein